MSKVSYMIESLTRSMITTLMEERGMTMREAMDVVYRSHTYAALSNPQTGLYYQSDAYVADQLEEELANS